MEIKNQNNMKQKLLSSALYLVVFVLIQAVIGGIVGFACQTAKIGGAALVYISLIASAVTIALFAWRKWSPFSREYVQRRQWFTLFWVVCIAIGCIAPTSLATELLHIDLPENYNELFKSMMGHDLGFLAIGILAPLAEEMVFRGAILRTLLSAVGKQRRWLAIGITALLFAVIHGNLAQGFGAFFLGLLIGWMYYRTGSIVPGVVFHWVNNSIAVILYRIAPQFADMTLTEYFQHDTLRIGLCMLFSLMIFGASLYQLRIRLN